MYFPGTPRLPRRVAGDHRRRRGIQRAGPLHRLHRLRVDLARPAATTSIATSSSATTATRPARSSRSPSYPPLGSDNPVELWKWMDAYEKKTGGSVLAIAHNGNLSNGAMFPIVEAFGKTIDREYVETAREVGAALRGHADEGRRRGASLPLAERRVRRLRDAGTRATSTAASTKKKEMLAVRVRPLGAQERPQARSRSSARTPTSSASSAAATRTPASPRSRRTTSSARPRRRSPARDRMTATFMDNPKTGVKIMDWEVGSVRLRRGLGQRKHARVDLGRHAAQGNLRHHRLAHGRALLRRLGLREGRRRVAQPGGGRLYAKASPWAAT